MVSNPNQSNLNALIKSTLSKCTHLIHLKQIQALLIILGHSNTQFYAFKLVRFCTLKLSKISYARSIFDALLTPNIYLYTALITAYTSLPGHNASFGLFRHMVRRRDPYPNQFIFPHVLKSCVELSLPFGTKLVHAQILKSGFGGNPVVQTALVDSYGRLSSEVGIARNIFDEMSERSVVSWTAMISGYARAGDMENVVCLFEEMPDRDVPSWNAVIAGCAQNGMFSEAIALFRRMVRTEKLGISRPNQVTMVCALSACGQTGMLQLGKGIHCYVYRNGFCSDSFVSNALVDMYGKCGNLSEARRVFNLTSKKSLTAWNSMINCLAVHGMSETAIAMFEEMLRLSSGENGVKPDDITFIGLLNACTHAGSVGKGRAYFELMTETYGIEARIEHYGCLIDLLGRAGLFDEALEIIGKMNMEPDEVVWGSLLNGCKIHGRMDLAEFAVEKLVEADPKNGGYGTMMANIYGELGKWDEVRKVRKMLKEKNAYKIPGCSWIEIDNQVHQFYSVDKTHPRTEDIYMALESLITAD